MTAPCQDGYDAYRTGWDDQIIMLHRGCLQALAEAGR